MDSDNRIAFFKSYFGYREESKLKNYFLDPNHQLLYIFRPRAFEPTCLLDVSGSRILCRTINETFFEGHTFRISISKETAGAIQECIKSFMDFYNHNRENMYHLKRLWNEFTEICRPFTIGIFSVGHCDKSVFIVHPFASHNKLIRDKSDENSSSLMTIMCSHRYQSSNCGHLEFDSSPFYYLYLNFVNFKMLSNTISRSHIQLHINMFQLIFEMISEELESRSSGVFRGIRLYDTTSTSKFKKKLFYNVNLQIEITIPENNHINTHTICMAILKRVQVLPLPFICNESCSSSLRLGDEYTVTVFCNPSLHQLSSSSSSFTSSYESSSGVIFPQYGVLILSNYRLLFISSELFYRLFRYENDLHNHHDGYTFNSKQLNNLGFLTSNIYFQMPISSIIHVELHDLDGFKHSDSIWRSFVIKTAHFQTYRLLFRDDEFVAEYSHYSGLVFPPYSLRATLPSQRPQNNSSCQPQKSTRKNGRDGLEDELSAKDVTIVPSPSPSYFLSAVNPSFAEQEHSSNRISCLNARCMHVDGSESAASILLGNRLGGEASEVISVSGEDVCETTHVADEEEAYCEPSNTTGVLFLGKIRFGTATGGLKWTSEEGGEAASTETGVDEEPAPINDDARDEDSFIIKFIKSESIWSINNRIYFMVVNRDVERANYLSYRERMQERTSLRRDLPPNQSHINHTSYSPRFGVDWYTKDFIRMGVDRPVSGWRCSDINKNFNICPSYPPFVFVPSSVSDDLLLDASLFRSRGRFPVLSWWSSRNKCSLSRSSQPLVGLLGKRSDADEGLIQAIRNTKNRSLTRDEERIDCVREATKKDVRIEMIIADARPRINVIANTFVGKGVETEEIYHSCSVLFFDIENIHIVRAAWNALLSRMNSNEYKRKSWKPKKILSSMKKLIVPRERHDKKNTVRCVEVWLGLLSTILAGANTICDSIYNRDCSVLVHCSDGWDRTSQLVSLSKLMLDPFYRTIIGFQRLVEGDWLSFGYKFEDRCGWKRKGLKDSDSSPIFQQFIYCVYQLICQYPSAFEFNEEFLICFIFCVESGLFPEFVFNTESERCEGKIDFEDYNWRDWLESENTFKASGYVHYEGLLVASSDSHRLKIWNLFHAKSN